MEMPNAGWSRHSFPTTSPSTNDRASPLDHRRSRPLFRSHVNWNCQELLIGSDKAGESTGLPLGLLFWRFCRFLEGPHFWCPGAPRFPHLFARTLSDSFLLRRYIRVEALFCRFSCHAKSCAIRRPLGDLCAECGCPSSPHRGARAEGGWGVCV